MTLAARSVISASLAALCLTSGALQSAGQTAATSKAPATATFAGGCFWCMEPPFDALAGVTSTTSGYTGGQTKSPTYEEVSSGQTGHAEVLQITYDPSKVTYDKLLEVFWRNVDAVDGGGQFCDRGPQYRPAIFYHSEDQKRMAEASKQRIAAQLGQEIPVQIVAAAEFYKAEEYHQDYYKKNPVRYKFYSWNCGREQRLEKLWGKQPVAKVTGCEDTESSFIPRETEERKLAQCSVFSNEGGEFAVFSPAVTSFITAGKGPAH